MYNLAGFRERVKELLRNTYLPNGKIATQNELAVAVFLSVAELSKRLNGAKRLTHENAQAIVRTLAYWEAISSEAQAVELLNLVECPPFGEAEWRQPPLNQLKRMTRERRSGRHNLPLETTSFIGREEELAAAAALLARSRLLTIVAAGGMGKTRLAVELGWRELDRYADGVYIVRLDVVTDSAQVATTVAGVLGTREEAGRPLLDTLAEYLRQRVLLLILDNCEQVMGGVARLVQSLLPRCPNLTVLATSREGLAVPGEVAWPLPPLPLPTTTDLSTLRSNAAIALFVARAQAALPGWQLNPDNAARVTEITCQVDGLPLAIELAAARVRTIGLRDIAQGLKECFQVLYSTATDVLPRQQTMYASIEWSWGLLTRAERRTLTLLAAFAPGFDLNAATDVLGAEGDAGEVVGLLGQLVQKSLLVAEVSGDAMRYRLLEPIRQYAAARMSDSGEAEATARRHFAHYLALAERASKQLHGAEQADWLAELRAAAGNLRVAAQWSLSHADGAAVRLGAALATFWEMNGNFAEGREYLSSALANGEGETRLRGWAMHGAAVLARLQSDYAASSELEQQAAALSTGDDELIAEVERGLGDIARGQGDYPTAERHYAQSLAHSRTAGATMRTADTLLRLGLLHNLEGDYQAAIAKLSEALSLCQQLGDRRGVAMARDGLGESAKLLGDYPTAAAHYAAALLIARELDERELIANVQYEIASLALMQGQHQQAAAAYHDCLAAFRELGSGSGVAYTLTALGDVSLNEGDYAAARRYYRESIVAHAALGTRRGVADGRYSLGLTEASDGHWAEATDYFSTARDEYAAIASRRGLVVTALGAAAAATVQGKTAAAHVQLTAALMLARANPSADVSAILLIITAALGMQTRSQPATAIRLLGGVDALISSGLRLYPCYRQLFTATTATIRAQLSPAEFNAAWQAGRATPTDILLTEINAN